LDFSASIIGLYDALPPESDMAFLNKLTTEFHRDETDLAATLLLIQSYIGKGNIQMASSILEKSLHAIKDLNVKYAPGLVSLTMSIFPKVGKEDKATLLLMEAKNYWNSKKTMVNLYVV
jgi:hypothetical protein